MEDGQQGTRKKHIIIIGVVVVAVVAIIIGLVMNPPGRSLTGEDPAPTTPTAPAPTPLELLRGKVTTLEGKLSTSEGKIADLTVDIGSLESKYNGIPVPVDYSSAIAALQDLVNALDVELATQTTTLAALGAAVDAELERMADDLAELGGNITEDLAEEVTALESGISGLQASITGLAGSLDALEAELESEIDALAGRPCVDLAAVTGGYEISVYGSGQRLQVNLYGSGLATGSATVDQGTISKEYLYAGGRVLCVIVDFSWTGYDTIIINTTGFTGIVECATVNISV